MHGTINVKSPNNISEWQMGFNSAFKGLSVETNTSVALLSCGYEMQWDIFRGFID